MDNKALIACCNICTLADKMKVCASCPFNPGKLQLKPVELAQVQRKELLTNTVFSKVIQPA